MLMINMLLSSHSKNMAHFSRFSNILWIFPLAKASRNMFQRKLEKLEKYLPYFFRDWTITYIYYKWPIKQNDWHLCALVHCSIQPFYLLWSRKLALMIILSYFQVRAFYIFHPGERITIMITKAIVSASSLDLSPSILYYTWSNWQLVLWPLNDWEVSSHL